MHTWGSTTAALRGRATPDRKGGRMPRAPGHHLVCELILHKWKRFLSPCKEAKINFVFPLHGKFEGKKIFPKRNGLKRQDIALIFTGWKKQQTYTAKMFHMTSELCSRIAPNNWWLWNKVNNTAAFLPHYHLTFQDIMVKPHLSLQKLERRCQKSPIKKRLNLKLQYSKKYCWKQF